MEINQFKEKLNEIFQNNIAKIVISNKTKKSNEYRRVEIFNKNTHYMLTKFTDKQAFTENVLIDNIQDKICEFLPEFKQFNFFGTEYEFALKISKSGDLFFTKSRVKKVINVTNTNNRTKNYIFKEGEIIEPLIDMGIFTQEGKVVRSMYDKYKQINRFIELIDDYIKDYKLQTINIVDFGCGKSYLTFLVYYYFKFIRKIDIKMTGLDLKADVIEKCNKAAQKYGYNNLQFKLGDINEYNSNKKIDMIITLHACDTATDYALYNAIKWGVPMIFSVPCCQHEVNQQIKSRTLPIITRYGLIKERIASDFTDIVRCNLLRVMSYNVDMIEFVGFEHTPKNLLIRANLAKIPLDVRKNYQAEVEDLMSAFDFNQTLYSLLKKDNYLLK